MESPNHFFVSKAVVVPVFLLVVLALEFGFPRVVRQRYGVRWFKNFGLAAINALASLLIVIPLTAFAARFAFDWRPMWWGGWLGLGLDLLLLDCWIYFWHRVNHVVPFLWRFHEVHHLDEAMDASSALRFHFGEVVLSSLVRAVVILILAVPISSVMVFETLVVVAAIFHHSNLRLPASIESILSKVIVTPSLHWVHHHAKREDTDSNYSTVLSVWDKLFGSRSATKRFEAMKIGVEGISDFPLFRLILRPFRR